MHPEDGNLVTRPSSFVDEGVIRPVVDKVFQLAEIVDVQRTLENGGTRQGRHADAVGVGLVHAMSDAGLWPSLTPRYSPRARDPAHRTPDRSVADASARWFR